MPTSGFFFGMPLAIATGHCYQSLWQQVGNSAPIPDSRVLLLDARNLDPPEREHIARASIPVIAASDMQQPELPAEARARLDAFAARVGSVYLHLDIDVLNPQESPGVDFRTPGGPSVQEMEQAIRALGQRLPIQAAAMTAYNPDFDQEDKTLQAGLRLLVQIAESAAGSSRAQR